MQSQHQREKVAFELNIPVQVTLQYPQGKIVSGRFGEQVMFGLEGNQIMFLDLAVAQKINTLEVQAGESVCICKRTSKIWDVWLSPETEKMRSARDNRGEIVNDLRRSVAQINERRYNTLEVPRSGASTSLPAPAAIPAAPEQDHQNSVQQRNSTNNPLIDEANALVDAYAAVLDRALTKHQGRIKPDEIKSILLSCYIQQGKAAKYAAA